MPSSTGPKPPLRARARRSCECGASASAAPIIIPIAAGSRSCEYPRIIGHELAVVMIDPARDGSPAIRCALAPYLFCGTCMACPRGRTNCCARLKALGVYVDGGRRGRLVVPVANLHPSASLSFDELALVEPLAIAAHAVARAAMEPGEQALVIGCARRPRVVR